MGCDYLYCGECKECYHEDCFPQCHREDCATMYDHPSDHGYYCIDCALKKEIYIKSKDEEDVYLCSKRCYRLYLKEEREELEKQAVQEEIDRIKKEQPKFKFIVHEEQGNKKE